MVVTLPHFHHKTHFTKSLAPLSNHNINIPMVLRGHHSRNEKVAFPRTPTKDRVAPTLSRLGGLLGVDLCDRHFQTPGERQKTPREELISVVRFLFFKGHDSLTQEIEVLRDCSPEIRSIQLALDRLKPHSDRIATPIKKETPFQIDLQDIPHFEIWNDRPSSPTLDIKHNYSASANTSANTSFETRPFGPESRNSSFSTNFSSFSRSDALSCTTSLTSFSSLEGTASRRTAGLKLSEQLCSPQKNFRVQRLVENGFKAFSLSESCSSFPFYMRIELYRIIRATCFPKEYIRSILIKPSERSQSQFLRTSKNQDLGLPDSFQRSHQGPVENGTFCGTFRWNITGKDDDSLLDLVLSPLQPDKSHSLQRKFGSDRFLVVDLPDQKPPHDLPLRETKKDILLMLRRPLTLLNRTWRMLHVPTKKAQVVLFAVSGSDIEPIKISEVVDYCLPIKLNAQQPACKAFARLDLAVSRTIPTITFERSQIHYNVMDKLAPVLSSTIAPVVMSDGCCEISIAAMNEVKKMLGLDYIPSVVQARILGAKGIWYRSSDDEHSIHKNSYADVWIKIAGSQIKAWHDLNSAGLDSGLLTLNVNNFSRPPHQSNLYIGFLPILVDRGVSTEAILEIARRQIQFSGEEYLSALEDGELLRLWVHRHHDLLAERARRGVWRVGGTPNSNEERIIERVEAGFEPLTCLKLAQEAIAVGDKYFDLEGSRFKFQLEKSTTVIGIADPFGCLEPNEVYLGFSSPFQDSIDGFSVRNLRGKEVLVARNPSMRNSDIQKVKAVYKSELEHLHDVIVFSSKGRQPVADMLSGGDYDGDNFWVCWEPTLVNPFKNAQAPRSLPRCEKYGILVDNVKLHELITVPSRGCDFDEDQISEWIFRSAQKRLDMNLLGIVTNYHSSYTYFQGKISSWQANLLVDLHDHLVDADKQGLEFDYKAWVDFRQQHQLPLSLDSPAYRRFTRQGLKSCAQNENKIASGEVGYFRRDITDLLYFEIVEPEVQKIKKQAREKLQNVTHQDSDLSLTYDQYSLERDSLVVEELRTLKNALTPIQDEWTNGMVMYHDKGKKPILWQATVERCRKIYETIQPQNPLQDRVKEWLRPHGRALTAWEELKASTLAKFFSRCGKSKMMFAIAGSELCYLKAQASGSRIHAITERHWKTMQPKALKRKLAESSFHGKDDTDGSDPESELSENDALFDGLFHGSKLADRETVDLISDSSDYETMTKSTRKLVPSTVSKRMGKKKRLG